MTHLCFGHSRGSKCVCSHRRLRSSTSTWSRFLSVTRAVFHKHCTQTHWSRQTLLTTNLQWRMMVITLTRTTHPTQIYIISTMPLSWMTTSVVRRLISCGVRTCHRQLVTCQNLRPLPCMHVFVIWMVLTVVGSLVLSRTQQWSCPCYDQYCRHELLSTQ